MRSPKYPDKPPDYKDATRTTPNWRTGRWKKLKTVAFASSEHAAKQKQDSKEKRKASKFALDQINGRLPSVVHGISLIQVGWQQAPFLFLFN